MISKSQTDRNRDRTITKVAMYLNNSCIQEYKRPLCEPSRQTGVLTVTLVGDLLS